jgi:hypothetical protein
VPERQDELIERAAAELRRPVRLDPALDIRVMAEVRARPRGRRIWLLRPRAVSVTPLGLLARAAVLAAVVAGATLVTYRMQAPSTPSTVAGSVESAVSFVMYAPGARSVTVVGDFNDWDKAATPLRRAGTAGAWTVTVPLGPGRYRYAFVVDGIQWLADPGAPRAPDDDFGTPNSVLTVGAS